MTDAQWESIECVRCHGFALVTNTKVPLCNECRNDAEDQIFTMFCQPCEIVGYDPRDKTLKVRLLKDGNEVWRELP